MIETLISRTALPNIHVALVHFPIALAMTALLVDSISLVLRKREWLGPAAALLYAMAALGSIGTYLSGRQAADSVGLLTAAAEVVLAEHADLALLAMIALILATVLRIAGATLKKGRMGTGASSVAFLVLVGANGLIAVTADHGGKLVYRHGVAVSRPPESVVLQTEPEATSTSTSPRDQLVFGDDGSMLWRPSGINGGSFDAVLRPTEGASAEVLEVSRETKSETGGVWLEVSGSTVVCFPGTFGDVVVTATVDLGKFEGVFGLGHHIQSVGEGVFFTISSGGSATLTRRNEGGSTAMNQGTVALTAGLVTMRTSVAGRHLKGQVGEATVAHGHGPSGVEGAVGLLLDGQGEVYITQVSVEPARDH